MNAIRLFLLVVLIAGIFLSGCTPKMPVVTGPAPTEPAATATPHTPTQPAPTEPVATEVEMTEVATSEAATVEPTEDMTLFDEVRIEFEAEDGVALVGSYFPATVSPAPTVILMHQAGSERSTWKDLGMIAWLHNRGQAGGALFSPLFGASLWPPMPSGLSFAVFTFDFRAHGESEGMAESGSDFLVDAKAAFQLVQTLDGVDPARIVMIGASIGADAAVDACVTGCLGALSFSPGSYLDVSYQEVVTELGLDGKPAWCLASEQDVFSANTCQTASGATFRKVIYAGGGHGESLLVTGLDPDIGQVVLDFFLLAFGITL